MKTAKQTLIYNCRSCYQFSDNSKDSDIADEEREKYTAARDYSRDKVVRDLRETPDMLATCEACKEDGYTSPAIAELLEKEITP